VLKKNFNLVSGLVSAWRQFLLLTLLITGSMSAWCGQAPAISISGLAGVITKVAPMASLSPTQEFEKTGLDWGDMTRNVGRNDWPELASSWVQIAIEVPGHLIGQTVFLQVKPAYLFDLLLLQQGHAEQRSGAGMAYSERSFASILPTFSVQLDQPETLIYLRLTGVNTHIAQLKLLSGDALKNSQQLDAQQHGFFFGAVLLMLVLSLLNLAWTQDSIYRSYSGFLASASLFFLYTNGYVAAYFWGEQPLLVIFTFKFVAAWVVSSTIFFSLKIMRARDYFPRLDLALRSLCWLLMTAGLLSVEPKWIVYFMQTNASLHLFAGILLLSMCGFLAWKLRTTQAYLLFGTYLVFTLLDKAPVLSQLNWVPVSEWTLEVRRIGYLFQLLPMHLLLVGKVLDNQRMKKTSDLKAYEAEQLAKSAQFERTELTRFLGLLTHEFRTPLAEIDAAVQSLELQPGAEQPQRSRRHARIRHSVKRLNSLVSNALLRERIESSGWQLKLAPCHLNELVENVLRSYKLELSLPPNAKTHRLEFPIGEQPGGWLELTLPANTPVFAADHHLIQIALGNLLDNARKYAAPASTVHLKVAHIQSDSSSKDSVLRMDVLSFGPVLSPEELARVFEKYWRRDTHAQVGGAGLGLPLVSHIMHLHNGSAKVQQLTGRWICFSLHLPIVQA
jgi:signal transduction histidine kinase